MTDAEKIAEVGRILDSDWSAEQKLAAIQHVLGIAITTRQRSILQASWNPDDDPEVRGRIPPPSPALTTVAGAAARASEHPHAGGRAVRVPDTRHQAAGHLTTAARPCFPNPSRSSDDPHSGQLDTGDISAEQRREVLAAATLAASYLPARRGKGNTVDVDTACKILTDALPAAAGLTSARGLASINSVRRRLAPYRDLPAVQQVEEDFREFAAATA
ncbi:hypothetical protein AB0F43_31365 [Kribbella sp. NPDC023972]|uniref:hypothetical protein n=1 Tax=Kribbella sp. NPDC023972 TaxID=3154795 RepID=UPI0033F82608